MLKKRFDVLVDKKKHRAQDFSIKIFKTNILLHNIHMDITVTVCFIISFVCFHERFVNTKSIFIEHNIPIEKLKH